MHKISGNYSLMVNCPRYYAKPFMDEPLTLWETIRTIGGILFTTFLMSIPLGLALFFFAMYINSILQCP